MIKKFLKRIVYGYQASSESYIKHMRNKGATIGENVKIFRPGSTTIDLQNPHLLKIGNNVQITGPVTILTHDYSWCVLKKVYGEILGNQNNVSIGDNCFIGWGATILAGTTIGENVIIGANSVVKGNIESNSVYAGNPAKRIMSLEDFYKKRKSKQEDEAINYINKYIETYNRFPELDDLNEYFFLFTNTDSNLPEKYISQLNCMGNRDESIKVMKNRKILYNSFEDLIKVAKLRGKK